jgi:hypothetical protein
MLIATMKFLARLTFQESHSPVSVNHFRPDAASCRNETSLKSGYPCNAVSARVMTGHDTGDLNTLIHLATLNHFFPQEALGLELLKNFSR